MKKYPLIFIICSRICCVQSQVIYPSEKIKLLSNVNPNQDSTYYTQLLGKNRYSGCWGWFQADKKREYALIGGTNGTYFIDITDPKNPVTCDFVQGRYCTWRELKTYKNYCYGVSDCGPSDGLQIIDMKYLPDSVHVVPPKTEVLQESHTIWIDGNKLYGGHVTIGPNNYPGMAVFSLSNPEEPVFLRSVNTDYAFVSAHDMYVRNDTVYACSGGGLFVLTYDTLANKFNLITSYTNYTKQGYTHSCYLSENGKYLVFCDEVPSAIPIHLVNVSNPENIQPVSSFLPYPLTTPHNPYFVGNDWVIVSCYDDGLHIYDVSDPVNVKHAGFFDTHPQSGFTEGQYYTEYSGNWGAYPYLPSKTIIALDMENGAFFLDASEIYSEKTPQTLPEKQEENTGECLEVYVNPDPEQLILKGKPQAGGKLVVSTSDGKILLSKNYSGKLNETISTENLSAGVYVISAGGMDCRTVKKVFITHRD